MNNQRYGLEQISSEDDDEEAVRVEGGGFDKRVKLRAPKLNHSENDNDEDDEDEDNLLEWVEKHVNGESSAQPSGSRGLDPPMYV